MEVSLNKVIVFELNGQKYGVDIQQVKSIEKLQGMTQVPQSSYFVRGVINLRGEITPVIDLKDRLNLGKAVETIDTRVLIVHINDVQVGLIVDSATEVIDIDESMVEPAPEMIGKIDQSFIRGVAKVADDLLVLLDVSEVLNNDEVVEVDRIASS